MLLSFEDGRPFAQGASKYLDRPATEQDSLRRIIVPVQVEHIPTRAILDTGGVYLVCNAEIADVLKLDREKALGFKKVTFGRWGSVAGTLHRLDLTLLAVEGEPLTLNVTAFVPCPESGQLRDFPCFVGWMGCLEWIRFAVDPVSEMFYFGCMVEGR
jgi:hypothetical protein